METLERGVELGYPWVMTTAEYQQLVEFPVTSTVGAMVAGLPPPAHPAAATTTRAMMTAGTLFMADLLTFPRVTRRGCP
jgi:hypothetical protein